MAKNVFMTAELVELAVNLVLPSIRQGAESGILRRGDMHIVVVNPSVPHGSDVDFETAILYQQSLNPNDWEHPYDQIALGKAKLSWRTGFPSHHVQQFAPHLYQSGDVRHGGSTIRDGIIVAVSGVQSYYDRMIAEWIASAICAMCIDGMAGVIADQEAPSFFAVPQ